VLPPDLQQRVRQLSLADVVDLALRNNPATRASWAQARNAAALFGSARGQYFPTLNGAGTLSRIKSPATGTRPAGERTEYGPSTSLSYLLLDFGGRSGSIERARQNLFAANLSHNATIQNTVLQAEVAYFTYMATSALLAAERSAIAEAQANLNAAQQRNRVGLATIADVLQARTALSQEQLNLETTQGNLQAARGSLASALGLPPNLPFELESLPGTIPVKTLAQSVDSVINEALRNRPDLAAARAQAAAAASQVRVARAAELPSLGLSGNAARTFSTPQLFAGPSYTISLGLSIPIFNGFSHQYDVAAARAQADAVSALADQTRQQVVTQVFVSYYALQTAEQRVATADDLLASAQQSVQVAAGRYREGVGSIIDLLTAQSALASARAQQVQSRWQWYTSLAQLARDAGVLGVRGDTPFAFSSDSAVSPPLPNSTDR
jgi:TolC family type I secretion outer membrane protein